MAWTTPRTWVAGMILTAAQLNVDIRDNMNALLALTGPSGSQGIPKVRAYNSANISIPNTAFTALTFDSERVDTDTMHSTVSNTGRLTCTTAGFYIVGVHVEFAANVTGERAVKIRVTNAVPTTTDIAEFEGPNNGGTAWHVSLTAAYQMAATDYFTVEVYQASGGALNILATPNISPEFWAVWQAP